MDFSESTAVAERMQRATKRLHDMAAMVGIAKQIREYDSDRRKNLLATYMIKYLKEDNGVSASDAMARADERYQEELKRLGEQLADAEKTIAQWNAEQASFEAARSLLSFSKATMEIL
jgi:hypothetical protein